MIVRTTQTKTPEQRRYACRDPGAGQNDLEHLERPILRPRLVVLEVAEEERRVPWDLGMLLEKGPEHRIRRQVVGPRQQRRVALEDLPHRRGMLPENLLKLNPRGPGVGRLLENRYLLGSRGGRSLLRGQAGRGQRQDKQDQRRVSNAMHTPKYGGCRERLTGRPAGKGDELNRNRPPFDDSVPGLLDDGHPLWSALRADRRDQQSSGCELVD